ncbi:histidine kinase [Aquimarina sp. TRL1]|uniref:sensor histidine kinase n=1 Tax=Aquimarina sp. (strain TRL1) TaxID=2736252 RepID=UPI00158854E0|nr:histidine kinase [Aquimarina sp. TRL1]QKX06728.1 histidine kinase [Aquimarina sp. TRL1]
MWFKKVKQSVILSIALSVTLLVNLLRILSLFGLNPFGKSFSTPTIQGVLIRILFFFVFSYLILQFNTNWKLRYQYLNRIVRVLVLIAGNIAVLSIIISVFIPIYQYITKIILSDTERGFLYFIYCIVLLILIFISRILRYQIVHQQDLVEKESLKRQSLQNELSALKNQINPHFLFNSLNSLNSLIRDNKEATTFVNKLSFMYRYILQSGQQDLVTLKEELKFLDSYIYLIKTRYRNRFSITIDIDAIYLHIGIPSMVLQLLVENAVKHNEISENNPLHVSIYIKENHIVVENKIRPRTTFVDSTGQGLANIDKRYLLLKDQHIKISDGDDVFMVQLPLK